ncbi:hypothetical protein [Helicobacter pylori]|nr:hypothetical protein [Helicobacter pylori]
MRNTILFGVSMILLANLCFGIMSAFVKITADYFPLWRMCFTAPLP